MKRLIAAVVMSVLAAPASVYAGPLCALASGNYGARADQQPSQFASRQMSDAHAVLCSSGRFFCPPYSFFQNHTAGNAQAFLGPSGGQVGILAHELGHLIDFSQNRGQVSQYFREAAADEYAGCAFALAGAPPSALTALQSTLFAMGSSPGYPNSQQRAGLIASGYQKCR